MTEKVAHALRLLHEEGIEFRMLPDSVEIQCGRLTMSHPGPGPCSSRGVEISIDGNRVERMLSKIEIRASVGEAINFAIELGGFA